MAVRLRTYDCSKRVFPSTNYQCRTRGPLVGAEPKLVLKFT